MSRASAEIGPGGQDGQHHGGADVAEDREVAEEADGGEVGVLQRPDQLVREGDDDGGGHRRSDQPQGCGHRLMLP